MSSHPSDQHLANQTSNGNQDAFEALYERRFQGLYDFAIRIVGDSDVAADVVQSTFVKTWEQLNQGKIPNNINAWIYTLARNAAIDELRHNKRMIATDLGASKGKENIGYKPEDPSRMADPQAVTEDNELVRLVWRAASMLRPEEFSLLDLYLRQGLSASEIADDLGLQKGAIYTRLSRLRNAMEDSITADALIRQGRHACPELDALLTGSQYSVHSREMRDQVISHFNQCAQCQETKRRYLSPTEIFAGLALLPAPLALKDSVWKKLTIDIGRGGSSWPILRPLSKAIATQKPLFIGTAITVLTISGAAVILMANRNGEASREGPPLGGSSSSRQATAQVVGIISSSTANIDTSTTISPTDSSILPDPLQTISPTITPTQTTTLTPTPTATATHTLTPTPTITPTLSPTQVPIIWEEDRFDSLSLGSLNGKHGWSASNASPRIVNDPAKGKILLVDPNSGATIAISKNIPNQSSGLIYFDFEVQVNNAVDASIAKIEFTTTSNAGWDKKFQLYFGSSMRANFSISGGAANFVSSQNPGAGTPSAASWI